jgi:hypothetical protein
MPTHIDDDVFVGALRNVFRLILELQMQVSVLELVLLNRGVTRTELDAVRDLMQEKMKTTQTRVASVEDDRLLELLRTFDGPVQ